MQQLLLRAVLPLVLAGSALQAQSGARTKSKDDFAASAMGAGEKQHQMERSMERGMEARHRKTVGSMGRARHESGVALVGVGGHDASGRVRVSTSGSTRTIALDSTFAIVGASGSGLYLSDGEQFDLRAVRVGALVKEMGAQSYQLRLTRMTPARHLLIVNETSHAVLARASLGGAMQR